MVPTAPRVLVTRAAHDARRWVADLQHHGITATALPLIDIAPVQAPALREALEQARRRWSHYRAIMFVSRNAVEHFFEQNEALALAQQAPAAIKTRCWAPGPGTAHALQTCGVAPALVDGPPPDAAQFDSEALWGQVAPQIRPGDRVLVVRGAGDPATAGGHGRNWLAAQLAAAGASVQFVAAYERRAPAFQPAQEALARAGASDGSLWLFSSSEALGHLLAWLPDQGWNGAHALTTHPRIAQAARAAGFADVTDCRPTVDDVAASIKSRHEH